MTEQEAPLLEFPCDYPIKVMGDAHEELHQHVLQVMHIHAPGFDQTKITVRESSKGKWQSITLYYNGHWKAPAGRDFYRL